MFKILINFNRYQQFVDKLSNKYNYPDNIRHILNLIIPSFILKYGIKEETTILKAFSSAPILIKEKENTKVFAYFSRRLATSVDKKFFTFKRVIVQRYQDISYVDLIDSLIHEYNHVLNSLNKEILLRDNELYLRTGISYVKYTKETLKIIETENVILEEIINVFQTEKILEKLLELKKYNHEYINNSLAALKYEIGNDYKSNSYYLQTEISRVLLKNKTFFNTLEVMRFNGEVYDIDKWFDNITGKTGSFKKLSLTLNEVFTMEKKLKPNDFLFYYKVNRLKEKINNIATIIDLFDNNSIFK